MLRTQGIIRGLWEITRLVKGYVKGKGGFKVGYSLQSDGDFLWVIEEVAKGDVQIKGKYLVMETDADGILKIKKAFSHYILQVGGLDPDGKFYCKINEKGDLVLGIKNEMGKEIIIIRGNR